MKLTILYESKKRISHEEQRRLFLEMEKTRSAWRNALLEQPIFMNSLIRSKVFTKFSKYNPVAANSIKRQVNQKNIKNAKRQIQRFVESSSLPIKPIEWQKLARSSGIDKKVYPLRKKYEDLVSSILPSLKYVVVGIVNGMKNYWEDQGFKFEDLVEEGLSTVSIAMEGYSYRPGTKPSSYFGPHIRSAIEKAIKEMRQVSKAEPLETKIDGEWTPTKETGTTQSTQVDKKRQQKGKIKRGDWRRIKRSDAKLCKCGRVAHYIDPKGQAVCDSISCDLSYYSQMEFVEREAQKDKQEPTGPETIK